MQKPLNTIIVFAASLAAAPIVAQEAQQKVLVAQCEAGQGCACATGTTTLEETAVLLGVETPPAGHVLLNTADGLSFDPRGLDNLHRAYGGQGVCQIDLFPAEEEQPISAGDIVPMDGLWAATILDVQFSQCNPMIETMLQSSGALNQAPESRRLNWNGRFDPNTMNMFAEEGQQSEWAQVGPNSWTGQIFDEGSCSGDACSGVSVDTNMTITSPTRIEATTLLNISSMMPDTGGMAEMAALGLADCDIRMFFNINRVGE